MGYGECGTERQNESAMPSILANRPVEASAALWIRLGRWPRGVGVRGSIADTDERRELADSGC